MKNRRHFVIVDLIEKMRIETQSELCEQLLKEGFHVTQATVSRDIKEIGLIKIPDKNGYFYALPGKDENSSVTGRGHQAFQAMVTNIDYSENIIVIKTTPGAAQPAALMIDHARIPEIMGCVAGDDTIMAAIKPKEAVPAVVEQLKKLLYDDINSN